jgi:hypothetical protein
MVADVGEHRSTPPLSSGLFMNVLRLIRAVQISKNFAIDCKILLRSKLPCLYNNKLLYGTAVVYAQTRKSS